MEIVSVCPDSYAANTYLLLAGGEAFAVDPAVSISAIQRALDNNGATLKGILLTHGHFDHTVSVDTLRKSLGVPLYIHENDAEMLTNGQINGFFDFYGKECVHSPAEKLLCGGDVLTLGSESVTVFHTPGHSKGSVCFIAKNGDGKDFFVTGDTLFSNSIGRCDLYGGDEATIAASLRKLCSFSPMAKIYPGHGPSASLGYALEIAKYYIEF